MQRLCEERSKQAYSYFFYQVVLMKRGPIQKANIGTGISSITIRIIV